MMMMDDSTCVILVHFGVWKIAILKVGSSLEPFKIFRTLNFLSIPSQVSNLPSHIRHFQYPAAHHLLQAKYFLWSNTKQQIKYYFTRQVWKGYFMY